MTKVLFVVEPRLSKFVYKAKYALEGLQVAVHTHGTSVIAQHKSLIERTDATHVVIADTQLLKLLVKRDRGVKESEEATLDKYAGSVFDLYGVKAVVWPNLITFMYGNGEFCKKARFQCRKMLFKIINPTVVPPPLEWETVTAKNVEHYYEMFKSAKLIAVDIETKKVPIDPKFCDDPKYNGLWAMMNKGKTKNKNTLVPCMPMISMSGYCGLFEDDNGRVYSRSIVLPIRTFDDVLWMRKFNNLDAPKITQNGGYEATYFIRYGAPLRNWYYDTYHFMHSWFAELKKDLNTICALFLPNHMYWKDENDDYQSHEYNAKDTYTTLWAFICMLKESTTWSRKNYSILFKKVFPAITCGMEGFLVDSKEKYRLDSALTAKRDNALKSVQTMVYDGFNPRSSQQVLPVMRALSKVKVKSTEKKEMQKWAERHPVNMRIANKIKEVREAGKALSTYVHATLLNGRLLYELNPSGTDTGRSSSKASNLWCGTQVQNIDNKLRTMYIADDGWTLYNRDGSQAESRCTAYLSQDATLIETVETAPDFHKRNASLFFGIPENEITKGIRDTAKRVNHGSNYNMGESVLIDTMGLTAIFDARRLLDLPPKWDAKKIAGHLLQTFADTYPDVKGKYYDEVIDSVELTSRLVGPTGWTRYTFMSPSRHRKDKIHLNALVAHPPQSLNVMILDEAFFDLWYKYQIQENVIRMKAQVHDEIIYQIRDGDERAEEVSLALQEYMERPTEVRGQTMIIPAPDAGVSKVWGNLK